MRLEAADTGRQFQQAQGAAQCWQFDKQTAQAGRIILRHIGHAPACGCGTGGAMISGTGARPGASARLRSMAA
jgi:hypothetical protein